MASRTETRILADIWAALGGDPALTAAVSFTGAGRLRSAYPVTGFAAGAVAAAALAATDYAGAPAVTVDRRLASFWFGWSFRAEGWDAPAPWDAVAGDYRAADGWIRLHTNAPHHRTAALAVLGTAPERDAVAAAVQHWQADELEAAVVARGGCAAAMRSPEAWAGHPQGRAVAAEPLVWRDVGTAETAPLATPDPIRPLAGVRVLDLTRVLAGPVATRTLAGLGADVLRIDPPGWDEPGVVPDVTLGKRCARLDARTPSGLARLRDLLRDADVLVHGYRPGALDALGLGAAERARLRPGLIDVSLDAYGWTGPWAGRRGFDSLLQMSTGIAAEGMDRFGAPKPTPLPVQALDHATGYILAAAALRGLTDRRRTGHGMRVRASLARTAALLTACLSGDEGGDLDGDLVAAGPEDFAPEPERTAWGTIRRLRPPLTIAGTPLRWHLPAEPLGAAEARWEVA